MRESTPSRQGKPPFLGILGEGKENLSSIFKCKLTENKVKEERNKGADLWYRKWETDVFPWRLIVSDHQLF